jgi:hypothetical protein
MALEALAASAKTVTMVTVKKKMKVRSGVSRGHLRICRGCSP